MRGWSWRRAGTSCYQPTGRRTSTPRATSSPSSMPSTPWRRNTTCRCCTAAIPGHVTGSRPAGSGWTRGSGCRSPWASTTTTASRCTPSARSATAARSPRRARSTPPSAGPSPPSASGPAPRGPRPWTRAASSSAESTLRDCCSPWS